MIRPYWTNRINALLIILLLVSGSLAQVKSKKKETPKGTPVMWQRVNIAERDLYAGPGGADMKPDLSKIKFIKKETGGTSKKYRIRDGAGNVWIAKVGSEAQSETAAVRLVWSLGYKTEVNYLVPKLTIPGIGSFTNVRLEARPENVKRLDEWKWKKNPFIGTNELQGLKVMMSLLNNWDLKDSNNKILFVENSNDELQYIISDLGATFGKTGRYPLLWLLKRSRNKPTDYAKSKFVNKVEKGVVKFHYGGRMKDLFKNITVEQVHWLSDQLNQLTDKQITDAFSAANYTPTQVQMLTAAVKRRIQELNNVKDDMIARRKRRY